MNGLRVILGAQEQGIQGIMIRFLGQDYHRLAQASEQRVLPERMTQWFAYCTRSLGHFLKCYSVHIAYKCTCNNIRFNLYRVPIAQDK